MSLRTTISWLLLPLSMWYAVGVAVRNALYAIGLLRQEAPHVVTIGVGNIATGGTGKTPMVEHLATLLAPHYRVAVLSRGYKRSTKGFVLATDEPDPRSLGDEAAMLAAKHPDITVAVCENRAEGLQHLMATDNPPQVVLLDDAYQHRRVKPSVNILLTDYAHPYYTDHILPYGNLREFRSARRRASIVVVTKCPQKLNPIERHTIANALQTSPYQRIYFAHIAYGTPLSLATANPVPLPPHCRLLLVTGIARPEPLLAHLQTTHKVTHARYADHHRYTRHDAATLLAQLEQMGPDAMLLTTEKDAAKLRPLLASLPDHKACYMPIETALNNTGDDNMDHLITQLVHENLKYIQNIKTSAFANPNH